MLVQNEGQPTEKRQYVRVIRTDTVERTFTYMTSSGEAKDYQACWSPPATLPASLEFAFTGSEPNRTFSPRGQCRPHP